MRTVKRYGWTPDLPDHRDFKLVLPEKVVLPSCVDLRSGCPAVYDQGQLGSCTANAIGAAHQFEQLKQKDLDAFAPSRLFIYYNERDMEGTVSSDSGAQIRDGMKSVATLGVCSEVEWPYNPEQFTTKPLDLCYTHALGHLVTQYLSLTQKQAQLQGCLAAGYPFVFGFTVYESFESATVAKTGVVPMPHWYDSAVGGHAVMAVGYDNTKKCYLVRNSWGPGWGVAGYFWLPYAYMTNADLASDFWTVRLVDDKNTLPVIQ